MTGALPRGDAGVATSKDDDPHQSYEGHLCQMG
jgi:hypothetical protein